MAKPGKQRVRHWKRKQRGFHVWAGHGGALCLTDFARIVVKACHKCCALIMSLGRFFVAAFSRLAQAGGDTLGQMIGDAVSSVRRLSLRLAGTSTGKPKTHHRARMGRANCCEPEPDPQDGNRAGVGLRGVQNNKPVPHAHRFANPSRERPDAQLAPKTRATEQCTAGIEIIHQAEDQICILAEGRDKKNELPEGAWLSDALEQCEISDDFAKRISLGRETNLQEDLRRLQESYQEGILIGIHGDLVYPEQEPPERELGKETCNPDRKRKRVPAKLEEPNTPLKVSLLRETVWWSIRDSFRSLRRGERRRRRRRGKTRHNATCSPRVECAESRMLLSANPLAIEAAEIAPVISYVPQNDADRFHDGTVQDSKIWPDIQYKKLDDFTFSISFNPAPNIALELHPVLFAHNIQARQDGPSPPSGFIVRLDAEGFMRFYAMVDGAWNIGRLSERPVLGETNIFVMQKEDKEVSFWLNGEDAGGITLSSPDITQSSQYASRIGVLELGAKPGTSAYLAAPFKGSIYRMDAYVGTLTDEQFQAVLAGEVPRAEEEEAKEAPAASGSADPAGSGEASEAKVPSPDSTWRPASQAEQTFDGAESTVWEAMQNKKLEDFTIIIEFNPDTDINIQKHPALFAHVNQPRTYGDMPASGFTISLNKERMPVFYAIQDAGRVQNMVAGNTAVPLGEASSLTIRKHGAKISFLLDGKDAGGGTLPSPTIVQLPQYQPRIGAFRFEGKNPGSTYVASFFKGDIFAIDVYARFLTDEQLQPVPAGEVAEAEKEEPEVAAATEPSEAHLPSLLQLPVEGRFYAWEAANEQQQVFDGTTYRALGRTALPNGLTAVALIRTTSNDADSAYAGNAALNLLGDSTNSVYVGFGIHGGVLRYNHHVNGWKHLDGNTPINDGEWHLVGVEHNPATKIVRLYVDGVLDAEASIGYDALHAGIDLIGAGYSGSSHAGDNFHGDIQAVAAYGKTFPEAERNMIMRGGMEEPKEGQEEEKEASPAPSPTQAAASVETTEPELPSPDFSWNQSSASGQIFNGSPSGAPTWHEISNETLRDFILRMKFTPAPDIDISKNAVLIAHKAQARIGGNMPHSGIMVYITPDKRISLSGSIGQTWEVATTKAAVSLGEQNEVIIRKEGKKISFVLNGQDAGGGTFSSEEITQDDRYPTRLGTMPFVGKEKYQTYDAALYKGTCTIDVFARSLTENEFAALRKQSILSLPAPSPVASWNLNDLKWENIPNRTASAFAAHVHGNVTPDKEGGLHFGGGHDYVAVEGGEKLNFREKITVMADVRHDSTETEFIVSKRAIKGAGEDGSYELVTDNDGKPSFAVYIGRTRHSVTGSSPLEPGKRYSLAATYDGIVMKLYVDGELAGATPLTGLINETEDPLRFGWGYSDRFSWGGTIGSVAIYDTALLPEQIEAALEAKENEDKQDIEKPFTDYVRLSRNVEPVETEGELFFRANDRMGTITLPEDAPLINGAHVVSAPLTQAVVGVTGINKDGEVVGIHTEYVMIGADVRWYVPDDIVRIYQISVDQLDSIYHHGGAMISAEFTELASRDNQPLPEPGSRPWENLKAPAGFSDYKEATKYLESLEVIRREYLKRLPNPYRLEISQRTVNMILAHECPNLVDIEAEVLRRTENWPGGPGRVADERHYQRALLSGQKKDAQRRIRNELRAWNENLSIAMNEAAKFIDKYPDDPERARGKFLALMNDNSKPGRVRKGQLGFQHVGQARIRVSDDQIFNLVLDNKEAVASLNEKIEELRKASNNVREAESGHEEQQSSKIVTPEGDVLSPMTPETLTRIRDLAKRAGESARARGDLQQAKGFDDLLEAANGLLQSPNAPERNVWIATIERMTTDPAAEVPSQVLFGWVQDPAMDPRDQTGPSVIYLYDGDVLWGQGHAAVLLGSDAEGWYYFSFGVGLTQGNLRTTHGNMDTAFFATLSDARSSLTLARYDRYLQWNVENDAAIRAAFGKATEYQRDTNYWFLGRNCDDVAVEIIRAAGISVDEGVAPVTTVGRNASSADYSGNW